jgi:hypothetical protein
MTVIEQPTKAHHEGTKNTKVTKNAARSFPRVLYLARTACCAGRPASSLFFVPSCLRDEVFTPC